MKGLADPERAAGAHPAHGKESCAGATACAIVALCLVALEALLALAVGAVPPLAAMVIVLVPGLAVYSLLPARGGSLDTRWAMVPVVGMAVSSVLVIGAATAGVALTGTSLRVMLLGVALGGLLLASRVRTGDGPGWARASLAGTVLMLAAVVALGFALQVLVIGGHPVPGNDWAHYLLYAQEIASRHSLLIDNPFWMQGMPFREDPGAPSLYGAYLVLSGQDAAVLAHGIWVFAGLGTVSVFVFVATLWGRAPGLLAAALYAVTPMNLTILGWHGLANVYALALLPLALLAAAVLLRGKESLRWSALLALVMVAMAAGHRLTFLVTAAALLAIFAVSLLLRFRATVRFAATTLAFSVPLGVGVAADLVQRSAGSGGVQDYHRYLSSKLDLELVVRDLTIPLAAATVLALGALLLVPSLRRDRGRLVLFALGVATAALALAWVAHLPSVYYRAAYYLPLLAVAATAVAWRSLPRRVGALAAVALVAVVAVQATDRTAEVRSYYTWTDAASFRGLRLLEQRLARDDVIVTDRCWSFLATWLLQRPTLAALDGTDILPAAEAGPAARARTILYADTSRARAAAADAGARYALVNPQCDDPNGDDLPPPSSGAPVFESSRLVVLDLSRL